MRHHFHTPLRHLAGVAYGHAKALSAIITRTTAMSSTDTTTFPTSRTVVLILQGPLTIGGRFLRAKTETAHQ